MIFTARTTRGSGPRRWLASIQQQLGARTAASFGYLRHSDLFVLLRAFPRSTRTTTSPPATRARCAAPTSWAATRRLPTGWRSRGDSIHSFNFSGGVRSNALGVHARNQGAGYANLSLRSLGRFSLSLGAREEVLSGGDSVFSPSAAAAYTLSKTLRLRGSAGHGFRLPTYTDLYYSDPATLGNPNLKPESSWSYEGGLDWKPANGRADADGGRLPPATRPTPSTTPSCFR